jgi:hypothetical protein
MRLQYDDEFDLDVRFTFSGMSSLAGGEPGRALPRAARDQTDYTKCEQASCAERCRTDGTQCDQDIETCHDTCPPTCQGHTCPAAECDTNTCRTQCGTCQTDCGTCQTDCGTCRTNCGTCQTDCGTCRTDCGDTCGETRCCGTQTCQEPSICLPNCQPV